mgnify:CR=1 FL=1
MRIAICDDDILVIKQIAVCLKKTVFGQQIQPILHSMDGFKIMQGSMQGYSSPLRFNHER